MDIIIIVEMIGTIAFAISGALVAIDKKLDYYGIIFIAVITATGGGVVRDILLDNTPLFLTNPIYAFISAVSALLTIVFTSQIHKHNKTLQYFDALGLATFTVIGAQYAVNNDFNNIFAITVIAILTATCGGILRDTFLREIPYTFRKEIYALAAVIGAITFFFTNLFLQGNTAIYIALFVTFVVRLLAMRFKLDLNQLDSKQLRKIIKRKKILE